MASFLFVESLVLEAFCDTKAQHDTQRLFSPFFERTVEMVNFGEASFEPF